MARQRKKFVRKSIPFRRDSLISATLSLIATEGIDAATVRAIAKHADVTPGLIRYYFSTKEDLISAAYKRHMSTLTGASHVSLQSMENAKPAKRLAAFVSASLTPPVADPGSVALWAAFLNRIQNDEKIRMAHKEAYYDFRDRLEVLIGDVFAQVGKNVKACELVRLAIASNAVIDGLWLEGGALPDAFKPGEIAEIGLKSIGAIIGVALPKGAYEYENHSAG